jgi:hypothetical protein
MVSTPERINFGSIAGRDLAAMWNGREYRTFRERLSSDDPPGVCAACAVYRGTF